MNNNKRNIIVITLGSLSASGGVQSHCRLLKDGMEELGYSVRIISEDSINKYVLKIPREIIWFLHKYENSSSWAWIWYGWTNFLRFCMLFLLLKESLINKPVLVIIQEVPSFYPAFLVCSLFRIKSMLMVHDYYYIGMNGLPYINKNKWVGGIIKQEEKIAFRLSKKIVAVDTRLKEYAENYYAIHKEIKLLFNCPHPYFFKKYDKPSSINIDGIVVHKNHFVIACVRRLVPKNGVKYAVSAMKLLPDSCRAKLYIGGTGTELEYIKSLIVQENVQDKVVLLGDIAIDSVLQLYRIADIALVPSINWKGLEEATSIAALEAMALGLPVVAFGVGGLKEIVKNMENGILVAPENIEALADAIKLLCDNRSICNRMSDNACNYVRETHHYSDYFKKLLSYANIIS